MQEATYGFQAFSTCGIRLETQLGTKDILTAVPKTVFILPKAVRWNVVTNKENEAVVSDFSQVAEL